MKNEKKIVIVFGVVVILLTIGIGLFVQHQQNQREAYLAQEYRQQFSGTVVHYTEVGDGVILFLVGGVNTSGIEPKGILLSKDFAVEYLPDGYTEQGLTILEAISSRMTGIEIKIYAEYTQEQLDLYNYPLISKIAFKSSGIVWDVS